MVDLTIPNGALDVQVLGWSKVWALKSRIRVPLGSVRAVRHDPEAARGLWKGWRVPGTHVPGVITAGTYRTRGQKHFWDVRRPGRAVVVELEGADYDRLIVDVRDPGATVRMIERAAGLTKAR